jgi:hypothetical protein
MSGQKQCRCERDPATCPHVQRLHLLTEQDVIAYEFHPSPSCPREVEASFLHPGRGGPRRGQGHPPTEAMREAHRAVFRQGRQKG